MTTVYDGIKKCMHCGTLNDCFIVGSTITLGQPDLDTRPAPLARQTIEFKVLRCSNCNYASADIEKKIEFDDSILTSPNYLKVLNSDYPELAKNYILASMIRESVENYNEAAFLMLHACWVLDDKGIDAKETRLATVKLFEKTNDIDTANLIMIDLLRRAEKYEEAKVLINKCKKSVTDKMLKRVLQCQEVLVDSSDSKCHTCSEIDNFIGDSGQEENKLEEDSMEDIERKLFDENCDEPIYMFAHGERVTFHQIAVIPLKDHGREIVYALLHPEDIADEDEAVVFELVGDEKLEALQFISDESIIDKVFDEYYRLIEDSKNE